MTLTLRKEVLDKVRGGLEDEDVTHETMGWLSGVSALELFEVRG